MFSHSILRGSSRSELQFIDDLINLCKRHQIGCGEPQDLDHLGADLLFNDDFRTDLFTLCTAIGHMTEVEPAPEQLLILVARAFGGPAISIRDVTADIPHSGSSAFLNGFETWSKRELNPIPDPSPSTDRPMDLDQPLPPPLSRHTLYFAAAARSGTDSSQTHEDPPANQSVDERSSHISISPNTTIESLTLNELRMYLEDIENRVSRIQPKLDHIAPRPYFSPEYFEKLEALDGHKSHNTKPPELTHNPEPAPQSNLPVSQPLAASPPQSIVPIVEAASAPPDIPYTPIIVPYQATIAGLVPAPTEISHAPSDIARLRQLRTVNMLLIFFLAAACCLTAFFAYRYLTGHPPSFTDTIHRFPTRLDEQPSEPGTPGPTATGSQPAPLPPATLFIRNPVYNAVPAVHITHSPKISRYPGASASGVSIAPASAKITASPTDQLLQARPSISDSYPDRNTDKGNDRSLPPTTFATISHASSNTTDTPTPSPSATVSVPSTMMMSYAIAAPKPIYPSFRHIGTDSTVEVETTISKEGRVVGAKALDGTLDVRAAAVEAVLGWRFKPFLVDGRPVGVVTTFKFVFKGN